MSMILATGMTEMDRRSSVRELGNISSQSYPDTRLDRKIDNADAIALAKFGLTAAPADDNVSTYRLVMVSNLQAAILIQMGLDSDANVQRVRTLKSEIKDIIESHNQRAPFQHERNVEISVQNTEGTFS